MGDPSAGRGRVHISSLYALDFWGTRIVDSREKGHFLLFVAQCLWSKDRMALETDGRFYELDLYLRETGQTWSEALMNPSVS